MLSAGALPGHVDRDCDSLPQHLIKGNATSTEQRLGILDDEAGDVIAGLRISGHRQSERARDSGASLQCERLSRVAKPLRWAVGGLTVESGGKSPVMME
jgi:hypothetical protein